MKDRETGWTGSYVEPDDKEVEFEKKRFFKNSAWNPTGLLALVIYLAALIFYLWARCKYTLNPGHANWLAAIFLVLEMMVALNTIIMGLNLVVRPVSEHRHRFKDPDKGAPSPKQPYQVRILVPCQYESLAKLQGTVNAALQVIAPKHCTRTIYVIDDATDTDKQAWCQEVEDQGVVYLTGRKRRYWEEINPKASQLNWALKQLYPATEADGLVGLREVVLVLEPGKIPSQALLAQTLYLFDSGANVGLLLTPACLADTSPGGDIFDALRTPHWEACPGHDAQDYIDATGCTYLARARALQQVGWLPHKVWGEDYALGMRIM